MEWCAGGEGLLRGKGGDVRSFVTQNGSWCFKDIRAREGKTREKRLVLGKETECSYFEKGVTRFSDRSLVLAEAPCLENTVPLLPMTGCGGRVFFLEAGFVTSGRWRGQDDGVHRCRSVERCEFI